MSEAKIWGDGFAEDGWRELILVRDWTLVSSDEFVRLFPALIPADGEVAEPVRKLTLRCPVVAANCGSMLEVCGRAAVLASPDDPSAWLAHFDADKASPTVRTELRDRKFERVKRFSWAESARASLNLYGHSE